MMVMVTIIRYMCLVQMDDFVIYWNDFSIFII